MGKRKPPSSLVESEVLTASRRRCCLCVFLSGYNGQRKGQIAHLNRNPGDSGFENLVFLCLDHHDEYDTRPSQSKGLSRAEVRKYRDMLYRNNSQSAVLPTNGNADEVARLKALPNSSEFALLQERFPKKVAFMKEAWRYPLWQVANQADYFAYKAGGGADGVCLIERIDLPDGRIVIACIQTAGNPGASITNCVEDICFQVCVRFNVPAERLVWLEHYDFNPENEWNVVTFEKKPPEGPFQDPTWTSVSPDMWRELRLKPRKRLRSWHGTFESKLRKLFHWPTEAIL
jgi:hypothetical protein